MSPFAAGPTEHEQQNRVGTTVTLPVTICPQLLLQKHLTIVLQVQSN